MGTQFKIYRLVERASLSCARIENVTNINGRSVKVRQFFVSKAEKVDASTRTTTECISVSVIVSQVIQSSYILDIPEL